MSTHADQTQKNKSQSVANTVSPKQNSDKSTLHFADNRAETVIQRKLPEIINNSPQAKQTAQLQEMADNYSTRQGQPIIQKQENKTGLPDSLKSGIEHLSGYSMDDVTVNYNSQKPAQLQAHAYAQGTAIHIASGQEKHLPHEAWHVVQQKQGRVKPTLQMKRGVNVNDDQGLEKEADVMGTKALMMKQRLLPSEHRPVVQQKNRSESDKQPVQMVAWNPEWTEVMDEQGLLVLKETLGDKKDTDAISDNQLRELREYLANRKNKQVKLQPAYDAIEMAFAQRMRVRSKHLTTQALAKEGITSWTKDTDKIIAWIMSMVKKEETETFEPVFKENRMTLRQVNESGNKADKLYMDLYHIDDFKDKTGVRKAAIYGRGVPSNEERMNPDNFLDDKSGPIKRNALGLHEVGATLLDGSRSIEKQMKPYLEASQIFMPVPSEHDHQVLSGIEGLPDKNEGILDIIRAFTTRITKAQASDMATGHVYTSSPDATNEDIKIEYGLTGKAPVNSKYDGATARKATGADIEERHTRALEYKKTLETLKHLKGKEVAMHHRLHGSDIFPIYTRWLGKGKGFLIYKSKDGSLNGKTITDKGKVIG